MRNRIVFTLAALLVSAAIASPVKAITGNSEKDFVHDYVGLMVVYTTPDPTTGDPFSHRCSGSLISPTVMVTAGHCTAGVDEGRVYFQQSVAPNYDPTAFGGWGGDPGTGYPYENGITVHRADNYGFDDFASYPDTHDVGVVVLDEAYYPPSGTFGILPTPRLVDQLVADAGSNAKKSIRFRTSGYGLSDQDPRPVSFRERQMAWGYLIVEQQRRDRVQHQDHRKCLAGQGRLVQRRLRWARARRRHEHHRGRRLLRDEPAVQGPGLHLPTRSATSPRLDQRPEPRGRRIALEPRLARGSSRSTEDADRTVRVLFSF